MKPKIVVWILSLILPISPVPSFAAEQTNVLPRSSVDRPDELSGYQIRLIYVVPADRNDRQLDEKGYFHTWISQVIDQTKKQIGLTPRFDRFEGKYDIGFLKSKHTVKELSTFEGDDLLLKELPASETLKLKSIGFVIDRRADSLQYCGYAGRPGSSFVVYLGENCWEDTPGYNEREDWTWIARAILHEWLHNLGVEHTCVENDLMHGEGCDAVSDGDKNSIDAKRENYIRGSKSGLDVSLLPVWEETYKTGKIQVLYDKTLKDTDPWRDPKSTSEIWGYFALSKNWSVSSKVERSCNVVTATGVILRSKITNSTCESDIPGNLKIGTIIYMTMNTTGLWQESIETLTFRVKGERGETEYCESKTCVVGETIKIDIDYCFKVDGFAALQKKTGEEWIDLKVHRGTKNLAGCKGDFPFSFETNIRSLGEGVHTLRWKRADNRKFSTSTKIYQEFQITIVREVTK
jgi:hypothetical protein